MDTLESNYDHVGDFNQGIAIVVKDGLYGAILMGGNEIIAPSYEYIAPFKDGYAHAIRKGECIIVNLSGGECKEYNGKLIAIPAKYDTVRDFKDGYACVQLDGKWGVIDVNGKEIYEPQFYFISDFICGTAKYIKNECSDSKSWGYLNTDGFCSECNLREPEIESDGNLIIERDVLYKDRNGFVTLKNDSPTRVRINNKGHLLVKNGTDVVELPERFLIANDFTDGLALVQDSTGYWGAVDTTGRIVVPLQYSSMKDFSESKTFATNKNGKLCLISSNGAFIKEFDSYTDGQPFKNGYATVSVNDKQGIINSIGKEILSPIDGCIHSTTRPNEFKITSSKSSGKEGIFVATTGLLIKPFYKTILEVMKDCVKVEIEGIGECFLNLSGQAFVEKDCQRIYMPDWCIGAKSLRCNKFIGISNDYKWGIIDSTGESLCLPMFDNVIEGGNGILYLERTEFISTGWRKEKKAITKHGLYNTNSKVLIPAEYDIKPGLLNGAYKVISNALSGIINEEGNVIIKPEWKHINPSNGYYIIDKASNDYPGKKGLANKDGKIIIPALYDEIVILREGLFKARKENHWLIFNEKGRLTYESFDEICVDGENIAVSKNGLQGLLNGDGKKIIKSDDNDFIELPEKFSWGYDFKDGIAKVIIKDCVNFVDKSFNIVIVSEGQIIQVDKVDYIKSKDNRGNYIYVSNNKQGIINHSGEILIEAKYLSVSHLSGELYIAEIEDNGNHQNAYGIIDERDKTVLEFEYSDIKPYKGKILNYWVPNTKEVFTGLIDTQSEEQYWYIRGNGYGLIDRNGKICIPAEYRDIQQYENGFIVDSNYRFGIINDNYQLICEPKYNSIKPIGNGLLKVTITSLIDYSKRDLYGILDSSGKERLKPIYSFIGDVNDDKVAKGRAIINLNNQLGLVDENYCILAEPQYDRILDFTNGKASVFGHVSKPESPGIQYIRGTIDINGVFTDISDTKKEEVNDIKSEDLTATKVKNIKTLGNGLIVVQKDNPNRAYQYCAIIDKDNNVILPFKYHGIEELENGMYRVWISEHNVFGRKYYGLLDQDFKEVLAPKYSYLRQIQDLFVASIDGSVGLINSKGDIVIPFEYSSISAAEPGYVWLYKEAGERIGLATIEGNIIFNPYYGKTGDFKNGLVTVNDGYWYDDEDEDNRYHRTSREFHMGKWGVISTSGEIVLPTIFNSVNIDNESFITAQKTLDIQNTIYSPSKQVYGRFDRNGYLLIKDKEGNWITASKKYDWQEDYNDDGQSIVYYKGYVGVVNEQGQLIISLNDGNYGKIDSTEVIIPDEYDWAYEAVDHFIIIEKNGKKGIIDNTCNLIAAPIYDHISILTDNDDNVVFKCGIQDNSSNNYLKSYKWSLLSPDGTHLVDTECKEIIHLGFSLLALLSTNRKYSIINFKGKRTLDIDLDNVHSFGETSVSLNYYVWNKPTSVDGLNYAIIGKDKKYGIIDNQGRMRIPPKYSSISIQKDNQFLADGMLINSSEQRIVVKDDSVLIITEDYDRIEILDNSILLVSKNNLFGCINQVGTVVIPLKYKSLSYKSNLLIAVYYDEADNTCKQGVIDFNEKQIIPFSQKFDDIVIESNIISYKQDRYWGAYTLQGKIICEPIYDHIVGITEGLIKVGKNDVDYKPYTDYYWEDGEQYSYTGYSEYSIINWGIIDYSGQELLPLEYREISDTAINGLIKIQSKNLLGYVDIVGHIILEPCYNSIGAFCDGYAVVSRPFFVETEDGREKEIAKYGVINSQCKEIIPCVYRRLEYDNQSGRFKSDVGYITLDGRYIAEADGKEFLLDKKYKYCKPYIDSCAIAVRISDGYTRYGLIDKKANDILPPVFSYLVHVENDIYKFKLNQLYGLINSNGNIILQNKYAFIGEFEDNIARVQIEIPSDTRSKTKKLYGYIDLSGNEILPPSYEIVWKRSGNYSVVMNNNLWGLFDFTNHQVSYFPNAAFIGACKENLCRLNIGGKYDKSIKKTQGGLWGFMSADGQIVIEPIYEHAYGFFDGMAAIKLNDKWGFINSEGSIVIPCEYDDVESSFQDGVGKLVKDGNVIVFDKSGKEIDSYEVEDEDDNYYDDDNYTPSIYDNPYYNDNLDMDQQSIEFWNSL